MWSMMSVPTWLAVAERRHPACSSAFGVLRARSGLREPNAGRDVRYQSAGGEASRLQSRRLFHLKHPSGNAGNEG